MKRTRTTYMLATITGSYRKILKKERDGRKNSWFHPPELSGLAGKKLTNLHDRLMLKETVITMRLYLFTSLALKD